MSREAPGWVTLTDGEEVVWTGHPSLVTESGSILLGAVLVAVGTAVMAGFAPTGGLSGPLSLVGVAVVLVGVLVVVTAFVRTRTRAYVLTTEEAYAREGLLSRTVRNVRLDRIQNTGFSQSLTGRLVGVGTVHLDTAGTGGTEFVLSSISNPDRVNALVTEQLDHIAERRRAGNP